MGTWKTPNSYITEVYTCSYSIYEKIGCVKLFHEMGFFKNGRWDEYGKYQTLCKKCDYFIHSVGVYFGQGNYTEDIQTKETVFCYKISTQEELLQVVSTISKSTKVLILNDVRVEDLTALNNLRELECVLICYCPKLNAFWDFQNTPNLKVFRYTGNKYLLDITQIGEALNLEYFEMDFLTSQTNNNHVYSFRPLTKLKKLKEVVLRGVTCLDDNIDALIHIENLEKLWISPNAFSVEAFAKFEALKFMIYNEYGIFQAEDYSCPLGKGQRSFRSQQSRENFKQKYSDLMSMYKRN